MYSEKKEGIKVEGIHNSGGFINRYKDKPHAHAFRGEKVDHFISL
jgi:hypothetical protein